MATRASLSLSSIAIQTAGRDNIGRTLPSEAKQLRRIAALRQQASDLAEEITRRERAAGLPIGPCCCCGEELPATQLSELSIAR
ncbi:MAG: hypothetical protein ACREN2_06145 [Candidatus Dormibacteria bacterium]